MVLGGVLAAADESTGGDFTVAPNLWFLGFLIALLAAALVGIVFVVRTPPRALRLAELLTRLVFWGLLIGTVLSIAIVLSGSRSALYSSGSVSFGNDRVSVSGVTGRGYQSSEPSDSHSRSRLAYELGKPAYIDSGNRDFTLEIKHPGTRIKLLAAVSAVWHLATWLLGLWALGAFLRLSLEGDPFGQRSISRLRLLALAFVLAGPVAKVIEHLTTTAIVRAAGGTGAGITWGVSLIPVFGAVLVLALAEVWRHGIALQREAEATV